MGSASPATGKVRAAVVSSKSLFQAEAPTTDWSSSNGGELLVTRSLDHGVEVEDVILVGAPPVWRADEREIQREVGALKRAEGHVVRPNS